MSKTVIARNLPSPWVLQSPGAEGREILDDLLSCYPGSDTALNLFRLAHFTDDEN